MLFHTVFPRPSTQLISSSDEWVTQHWTFSPVGIMLLNPLLHHVLKMEGHMLPPHTDHNHQRHILPEQSLLHHVIPLIPPSYSTRGMADSRFCHSIHGQLHHAAQCSGPCYTVWSCWPSSRELMRSAKSRAPPSAVWISIYVCIRPPGDLCMRGKGAPLGCCIESPVQGQRAAICSPLHAPPLLILL